MIRSDSFGAKVEKLYKKVDKRIEEHYKNQRKQPKCKKGCYNCCTQYFEISDIEYAILLKGFKKLSKEMQDMILERVKSYWQQLCDQSPSLAKHYSYNWDFAKMDTLMSYFSNPFRFKVKIPCVFLHPIANTCLIYEYRPLICRIHGVAYERENMRGKSCKKIKFSGLAKRWQTDLTDLAEELRKLNIFESEKYKDDPLYELMYQRPYPILYNLYHSFFIDKTKFKHNMMELYYEISAKEYFNSLFAVYLKNKRDANKN